MDKQNIFDNIEQYSPEDIVRLIKQGVVTQEELKNPDNTGGYYSAEVRNKVDVLLRSAEPNDWAAAQQAGTVEAYQRYLEAYPAGAHRKEAEEAILRCRQDNEDQVWKKIVATNTIEAYQRYLDDYPDGEHRDEARDKKEKLREAASSAEDKRVWDAVDKDDIDAVRKFMKNNPQNIYCKGAQELINDSINSSYFDYTVEELLHDIDQVVTDKTISDPQLRMYELIKKALDDKKGKIEVDDILDIIELDNNRLPSLVISRLIQDSYFSYEDLEDLGISREFVRQLAKNTQGAKFEASDSPLNIDRVSTELYFWGIPSSGKTCALGAILRVAGSGTVARTMMMDPNCQGYDYMNRLPQCFDSFNGVAILPGGTPVASSYEMGFDLIDDKHKRHPITCIDFAGELIRCMYKKISGKPLTIQEQKALQDLTDVLGGKDENGNTMGNRTKNRKIHFFVVEYGAENRMYEGLPQRNYLDATLQYIDQMGIFKTNTDAIFLIVTKVDKIKARNDEERNRLLLQYIKEKYAAFYGGLEQICITNRINGGIVRVLPFSVGTVCFQDLCKFDARYAESIVDIILKRSHGEATGKIGFLSRIFKG